MSRLDLQRPAANAATEDRDAHDLHPARSAWLAWLGTLGVLICYTMPMMVLPPIAADLRAGATAQTWLISAVNLGLGVALLPAGTLADNRGRKRVFVAGLALLAVGTLLCGVAGTPAVFVAGRAVQGVGGAAVLSTSLAVIAHAYQADAAGRVRATAIWGAMLGAGIAVSPVLVGVLSDLVDWRLAYWGMAPFLVALTLLGLVWLTDSRAAAPRPLDARGAVLSVVTVGALMALVSLRGPAWGGVLPFALGALAAAGAASFVVVQRRARHPLLPLDLFRSRPFLGSLTASWVTGMASIGLMSYLPTVVSGAYHLGVLPTAMYFFAWAAVSAGAAAVAPRLLARASARRQAIAGLAVCAAGHTLLVLPSAGGSPAWLLPGLVVAGVGVGTVNANVGRLAIETAPEGRSALGSGVANTFRYIGSAVGLPIVIALVAAAGPGGTVAGMHVAALATAAMALAGALLLGVLADRRPAT